MLGLPVLLWIGGALPWRDVFRARQVVVFAGRYADAKRVITGLDSRALTYQAVTDPQRKFGEPLVLIRVHSRVTDEARQVVRDLGFTPPPLSHGERSG